MPLTEIRTNHAPRGKGGGLSMKILYMWTSFNGVYPYDYTTLVQMIDLRILSAVYWFWKDTGNKYGPLKFLSKVLLLSKTSHSLGGPWA